MARYYTKEHLWAYIEGDEGTFGLTKEGLNELGRLTHIALPGVGEKIGKHAPLFVIESTKAAYDLAIEVEASVIDVCTDVTEKMELIEKEPLCHWLVKVRFLEEPCLEAWMDDAEYALYCGANPS